MDRPDGEPEGVEERERPVTVALHQIVVHRHHVDLLLLDAGEVAGQRGDDRLAFTGLHLRDPALAQDGAADELDVEGTGSERRPARGMEFTHRLIEGGGNLDETPCRNGFLAPEELALGRCVVGPVDLGLDGVVHRPGGGGEGVRIEPGLRIEDVPDPDGAIHRLPGDREGFGDQVVSDDALLLHPTAEFRGPGSELGVAQRSHLLFEVVHLLDLLEIAGDLTLIASAEEFSGSPAEERNAHDGILSGNDRPTRGRSIKTRPDLEWPAWMESV